MRPASLDDADFILEWRNDPETRKHSRNSDVISTERHEAWMRRVLDNEEQTLLVGVDEHGLPVGVVRFDVERDGDEISINLAPSRRGQGLGRELLTAALAWHDGFAPSRAVIAQIHRDNTASQRLFRGAGFVPLRSEGEFAVLARPVVDVAT